MNKSINKIEERYYSRVNSMTDEDWRNWFDNRNENRKLRETKYVLEELLFHIRSQIVKSGESKIMWQHIADIIIYNLEPPAINTNNNSNAVQNFAGVSYFC